uniref:FKBP-type peptidyl-prolyl cis-trans isomerase n=1 Tax=Pedobacter schmidteae TaxID=2201271 RepID=UPI000EACC44A|nr:FKBP-type peptidyl-prolyl cis-trans isomerase [Pedobacter schmidteae]
MLKTSALLGFVLMAAAFAACKKDAPYNEAAQMDIDDAIIVKYMADSNVKATKDASGLYYNIIRAGREDVQYMDTTKIYANYRAKILKDTVYFSRSVDSTFFFNMPGNIAGWKRGVELAKLGGLVRLLIPSPLAYQQRTFTAGKKIPPNSILDITLEIVSVNKKPK